jgi:phage replication-related protein YjqB (UPF0714/DUF867 family)
MNDRYDSFSALAREAPRDSWRRVCREVPASNTLILAPHGGDIEAGTSELAASVAGDDHNLYCFEGLDTRYFRDLHVTSHRFDDPVALGLAARAEILVAIHGCKGERSIYVGGRDAELVALLTARLLEAGFPARSDNHAFPATNPDNICNRGSRGVGAQLEFTRELRGAQTREAIAQSIRSAIQAHSELLGQARASSNRSMSCKSL